MGALVFHLKTTYRALGKHTPGQLLMMYEDVADNLRTE